MTPLERRYMKQTAFRLRKENREVQALHRELLVAGMFLIFALAFFADTVVEPTLLDPLIQEAQAADMPKTDAEWVEEICGNLGVYQNGDKFVAYCAGV